MQMTRRDVMRMVYQGQCPPYVPWVFYFTHEAFWKLAEHYGGADRVPRDMLGGHFLTTGQGPGDFFEPLGHDLWRDGFGVVWDRSVDKDIGVVKEYRLPEPTLAGYRFPDPLAPRSFEGIPQAMLDRLYPEAGIRVVNRGQGGQSSGAAPGEFAAKVNGDLDRLMAAQDAFAAARDGARFTT